MEENIAENPKKENSEAAIRRLKRFDSTKKGQNFLWGQIEYEIEQRQLDIDYFLYKIGRDKLTEPIIQSRVNELISYRREKEFTFQRNIDQFANIFEIRRNEIIERLSKGNILDIGIGRKGDPNNESYGEYLGKLNEKVKIISLDIKRDLLLERKSSVQANAIRLPFSDNSFDRIIACASMPMWTEHPSQVDDFFDEVVRVAKKGGEIWITPISQIYLLPYLDKDWRKNEDMFFIHSLIQKRVYEKLRELNTNKDLSLKLVRTFEAYDEKSNSYILDTTISDPNRVIIKKKP
ncbi:hypothetical protein A2955_02880 [Candidatus Woesebacteria bacterium RIFCSPLOWO2_01_FULL_37_19]|uniref:Methyltransferase type 11 domain-containing protein n=1 Tax=Candidatus Woesebacteria bacterium RIFCSPLOWO2_01_FULL_37_19 TaxID=1802514 RepID=A0A1F8B060_9BACT|nr:MAG: hypothetical protein A2955_02880 [Candidatus Woesebacteria bacterium RIFCSPLOWO2_01_FULL_37_19]